MKLSLITKNLFKGMKQGFGNELTCAAEHCHPKLAQQSRLSLSTLFLRFTRVSNGSNANWAVVTTREIALVSIAQRFWKGQFVMIGGPDT
jgi:hypothetical protein